jgi:hypothetical protein
MATGEFKLPPNLEPLFTTLKGQDRRTLKTVGKGSVITFNYIGQTKYRIHDPYPMIIVSDIFNEMIRGVNLNYLTLPYMKGLVVSYADNPRFSYTYIKGDQYIVGAFRSYKRAGISQLRILDTGFLRDLLKVVRSLEPGEIEQMRAQVERLLQEGINQPPAQEGPEIK